MMSEMINVKLVTDDAFEAIKANISKFTKLIQENDDNKWIKDFFSVQLYTTKIFKIEDFTLTVNEDSKDRDIDFNNGVTIYEHVKDLPKYILYDVKFWLWLILDKFYVETKSFMKINSVSTVKEHWLDKGGLRRALAFNPLARLFIRVERTAQGKDYEITKWIFGNPQRFRGLTWRNYSDNKEATIAILKGCKRASEDIGEQTSLYNEIANFISFIGGSKLIDAYSSEELENIVYRKYCDLYGTRE